jgi:hypothetical protein
MDATKIKRMIDLRDLAGRYTQLAGSHYEMFGPCPKCGGTDRFHVSEEWFFCRKCYAPDNGQPHDAIAFVRWMDGVDFRAACIKLAHGYIPEAQPVAPVRKSKQEQTDDWRERAGTVVHNAVYRLGGKKGDAGRSYLIGRGINQAAWEEFGMGFDPAVPLPGTWDADKKARTVQPQPAIVMPWYRDGQIVGVRYRFLQWHEYTDTKEKQRKVKQTSLWDSDFTGCLFGWQATKADSNILVLCEGELNAVSIWQVTRGMRIDVLSIGSQDTKLSKQTADYLGRYQHVLVWADQRDRAKAVMADLPGAYGMQSPQGKDANDWLIDGKLRKLITYVLHQMIE